MADEADSRHTTPTQRWGETAAEVPNATNVVEPSGGRKDTGWVPGVDGLVGEWLNWVSWAAGVFARYVENTFALGLTRNHVMAGAGAGEGAVTAGAGLSVNVAAARCWISGAMYAVPASTNLALAAADPTNPRLDLIVARVVALAPVYAVRTGTPAATPVAPAALAGDVEIATVRVLAAGVVPNTITSLREFGAVRLDRVIASKRFEAGDLGTGEYGFRVDEFGVVYFGPESDPDIQLAALGAGFFVKPDRVQFFAPITRKFDIQAAGFTANEPAGGLQFTGGGIGVWSAVAATTGALDAAVRVPDGCEITAVRVYGTKTTADAFVELNLEANEKLDRTNTTASAGPLDNSGAASGNFMLQLAGLSIIVDQDSFYRVWLDVDGGTGQIDIWGAEVEYEETVPWATV